MCISEEKYLTLREDEVYWCCRNLDIHDKQFIDLAVRLWRIPSRFRALWTACACGA